MKLETTSIEEAEKIIKQYGIMPEHSAKRSQSGAMMGSVYSFELPDEPAEKIEASTDEPLQKEEKTVDVRVKRKYTRRG